MIVRENFRLKTIYKIVPVTKQLPIEHNKAKQLNDDIDIADRNFNDIRPGEIPSELRSHSNDPLTKLHYIWCNTGHFQFRHFLSLSSAIRKFRPQAVYFHTSQLPPSAPHVLEWYEDIKRKIPLLELYETAEAKCIAEQMPSTDYLNKIIQNSSGHVIIQEDVIVNGRFRRRLRQEDGNLFVVSNTTAAYLLHKLGQHLQYVSCLSVTVSSLSKNCDSFVTPTSICYKNLTDEDICIHCKSNIHVREVPQSVAPLAAFIRYNFYGLSDIILPNSYPVNVIPKIGHYVYLGTEQITEKELSFEFYMSILSLLGIVKLDCVYIHGTVKFVGKYWNNLMTRNLCVHWHHWPIPKYVWQQKLKGKIEHIADIIRTQIFIQYGGLHMDPDAFFYHPLPDHYWRYEAILAQDAHVICPGFEATPKEIRSQFNLGICLSMPGSRYFSKYQDAQKVYHDGFWTYNSGEKPLQIYERNPKLAHLDPKLQVVCAGGKCYPSWASTESEANELANNVDLWFNETYAIHTVWPSVNELSNPRGIKKSSSIFGRIAVLILTSNNITLDEIENF